MPTLMLPERTISDPLEAATRIRDQLRELAESIPTAPWHTREVLWTLSWELEFYANRADLGMEE